MKMIKDNKFSAGFTLVEILVVVLIIGILAAWALPQYRLAVDESRFTQLISNTDTLLRAQQLYHMANGDYAISWEDLGADVPTGYTPSTSRTLESPDHKITISIGCSTPSESGGMNADCPASYLFSRDLKTNVAYWTDMKGKTRSCLAYAAGGEYADQLCQIITGSETNVSSNSDASVYRF